MPKISVIVIIYNVEKYLSECIESIIDQSYKDFELILVDDGSTDKCSEICDHYSGIDNRIKVIHQKNSGSVMARWNGLLASEGEYVSFIDGDDFIDLDMYEGVTKLIEKYNSDIIITGYKQGNDNGYSKKRNIIESGLYSGDNLNDIYSKMLFTGVYYESGIIPALWNKIIKRDLFFKDFVPIDPIIKMGDDAGVSFPIIIRSNSVYIDNDFAPYNYRIVSGSQSRAFDPLFFDRCISLFSSFVNNLRINEVVLEQLKYYVLFISEIGIKQLYSRKSGYSFIKKRNIILDYYKRIKNIELNYDYNWDLIESDDKNWLKYFINGKINTMIFTIYIQRIIGKLKRTQ